MPFCWGWAGEDGKGDGDCCVAAKGLFVLYGHISTRLCELYARDLPEGGLLRDELLLSKELLLLEVLLLLLLLEVLLLLLLAEPFLLLSRQLLLLLLLRQPLLLLTQVLRLDRR